MQDETLQLTVAKAVQSALVRAFAGGYHPDTRADGYETSPGFDFNDVVSYIRNTFELHGEDVYEHAASCQVSTPSWKWLASTRELQETSFGMDYDALKDDALADYLTWNVTALVAELGEFLNEVGWKNWAKPRGWVNREQAIGELVDAAHFLANELCALGVTDTEWEERYQAKQRVNADRQASGSYDGVVGKCPDCHRDKNETAREQCTPSTIIVYCPCGHVYETAVK